MQMKVIMDTCETQDSTAPVRDTFFNKFPDDELTENVKVVEKQCSVNYNHLIGLNVQYMRLLPTNLATTVFFRLERELEYLTDQKVVIHTCHYDIRRKHLAHGDSGLSYTFSTLTVKTKPWTPILESLRDLVSSVTGQKYNFVLINRYLDGSDCIGFHSDSVKEVDPDISVACISLGAERPLTFKSKRSVKPRTFTLRLGKGSLLLMHKPTNDFYYHRIPRRVRCTAPRISLTFRNIIP